MTGRPKVLAGRAVDVVLARRGCTGLEQDVAREGVRYWFRTRRPARGRRGSLLALGVVGARPGRADPVPVQVPLAGPDEVTVELLVSSISSGTERAQWLRLPHAQTSLPYRPGCSPAGRPVPCAAASRLWPAVT